MAELHIAVTVVLEVPDEDIIEWESDKVVAIVHDQMNTLVVNQKVLFNPAKSPAVIARINTEWPADIASRTIRGFHAGLISLKERTGSKFEKILTAVGVDRKG